MKYILILLAFFGISLSHGTYTLDKKEILNGGQDYLYLVVNSGQNYYVATNEKIEESKVNGKLLSSDKFWDPEHCAQMLTLTTPDHLYFFDTQFKENSSSEFFDVIYRYNIGKNVLETFRSEEHKNIYSVYLEDRKINIYYVDKSGMFYSAILKEDGDKFVFSDIKTITEKDIKYKPSLRLPDLNILGKYYIVQ